MRKNKLAVLIIKNNKFTDYTCQTVSLSKVIIDIQ